MQDGQGLNDLIQKELHGIDSTQIQDTCRSLEERILAMLGSSEARNAQEPPEEEEQGDDNENKPKLEESTQGSHGDRRLQPSWRRAWKHVEQRPPAGRCSAE